MDCLVFINAFSWFKLQECDLLLKKKKKKKEPLY